VTCLNPEKPLKCKKEKMEKGRLFSLTKASESALSNRAYRRVLYTTKELQYVEMHLKAGEEIGREMHKDTTQYFYVHGGDGVARVDG
jgi:mannose-6-phosphate isomerase-like protein (cupin superfamily)